MKFGEQKPDGTGRQSMSVSEAIELYRFDTQRLSAQTRRYYDRVLTSLLYGAYVRG